jgi:hypothetical protein
MFKANISAEGATESDLVDAIREALRRIEEGNTSGFDRNESGNFTFEVEEKNP